ncbi:dihydroneopterin aldolase [Corynebacterium sp. sy017]|uniref:dihydroneopterin aldolase n=1 Tax=unclassified Corynebacterium TaxID=2624378 RepID=UPI001186B707|nr:MULTISPECIES: dihydroneopterin aldolase [unclassified Corynebacterium]MBP3088566.1 dihydroneopterin aldolase [Corynebacterium sp. sy017]QDZ41977.1 dihydroneopterin aldolase [Corynebacterium sp. sy039]TSD91863.1 dihydroneopterin aldolase [Corynebacterium sp. SY003]
MDRIELRGLQAQGFHGVFEHEKREGQTFVVDVVCWVDLARAAHSDDLADTINYARIASIAHEVITGQAYDLIEKVAGTIADNLMGEFLILDKVEVSVHKPQAPIPLDFADVAVVIQRERNTHS